MSLVALLTSGFYMSNCLNYLDGSYTIIYQLYVHPKSTPMHCSHKINYNTMFRVILSFIVVCLSVPLSVCYGRSAEMI